MLNIKASLISSITLARHKPKLASRILPTSKTSTVTMFLESMFVSNVQVEIATMKETTHNVAMLAQDTFVTILPINSTSTRKDGRKLD